MPPLLFVRIGADEPRVWQLQDPNTDPNIWKASTITQTSKVFSLELADLVLRLDQPLVADRAQRQFFSASIAPY
jgi:hypothetical protein